MKLFMQCITNDNLFIQDTISFIVAGQSNAKGSGQNESQDLPSGLNADGSRTNAEFWETDNIMYPYQADMNTIDDFYNWGVEHRIAERLLTNNRCNNINLLKVTKGGTSIGDGGYWNITDGAGTDYLIAKANLAETSHGLTWDYFIWIQGENDATSESIANAYEANLTGFVNHLLTNINPNMKFIIVKLADWTAGSVPYLSTAQVAQDDVSISLNKQLVIPDTLLSADVNADNLHYTHIGIDKLATKIYNEVF